MITLRDIVRTDPAIASITADECRAIAVVLDQAARRWWRRVLRPDEALSFRMLAATLGRTAAERQPSFQERVRLHMGVAKPKDEWSAAELEGKHG